jgi:hypothetical protein
MKSMVPSSGIKSPLVAKPVLPKQNAGNLKKRKRIEEAASEPRETAPKTTVTVTENKKKQEDTVQPPEAKKPKREVVAQTKPLPKKPYRTTVNSLRAMGSVITWNHLPYAI